MRHCNNGKLLASFVINDGTLRTARDCSLMAQ